MKPYIVCHMMQSVDGRRACDMVDKISGEEYYSALQSLNCNSVIDAELIDELSIMIAPGIDGRSGQSSLFDGIKDKEYFLPTKLKFKSVYTFDNGVVWIRYEL